MHLKQSRSPWSPGGAARRDRLHAAAKVKENQGRRTDLNLLENSPKSKPIDTRAEVAKIAGVSDNTIARVEKIVQKAPEEVLVPKRALISCHIRPIFSRHDFLHLRQKRGREIDDMKAIFGDFGHLSKSAKDINRSSTVFRAIPTASAISCCVWPGQCRRDTGRHQAGTTFRTPFFAGNNRLPQPAPGRHRTGSPGGPRPVTAGFLRKSGVDPRTYTREEAILLLLENSPKAFPHPHAREGD